MTQMPLTDVEIEQSILETAKERGNNQAINPSAVLQFMRKDTGIEMDKDSLRCNIAAFRRYAESIFGIKAALDALS